MALSAGDCIGRGRYEILDQRSDLFSLGCVLKELMSMPEIIAAGPLYDRRFRTVIPRSAIS